MRKGVGIWLAILLCGAAPARAERLPTTTVPSHYDLAFDVDLAHARFEGDESIEVSNASPTTHILLHAVEITFHDVTVEAGGVAQHARVTLNRSNQTASLGVAKTLPAGAATIHIRYTGILNNELRGLYLSQANGRRYAISQLESTDARRMFPSFDEPIYKATFSLSATIDRGDNAISNGKVVSDTAGPEPGRHTLTFATSPRMSSYLVALAVGDFQCLDGGADNIPIRVCATPDRKALGAFALEAAQYVLHYYDNYYAMKYPFEKLDMVAVPDFAAGAMENTGAIFYRDTDLLVDASHASVPALKNVATAVAHEMAHQWFGDLVTMQWWNDLWLNEGFATWMESRPIAVWKPEWHMEVDQALDTQRAIALDSLKSTHAIRSKVETPAEIDESFDAIAYQKGAAVVRMIENYVGTDTFQRGVNAYLAAHAYGNATSEDFAAAIAAASGKPVDKILPTFVNQPGVPLVGLTPECRAGVGTLRLTERPLTAMAGDGSAGARSWAIPVCLKRENGEVSCDVLQTASRTEPGDACADTWTFGNARALGYYRTEYTSDALTSIAAAAEAALTAPERVSLSGDTWALVRSGHETIANFLTLAAGFNTEASSGVLDQLTEGLAFTRDNLVGAARRPAYEAFVRSLFTPDFERLGIAPGAHDGPDSLELRATVVDALGNIGDDPTVAREARRSLDAALSGGAPLDPASADAIVSVAATHGDAALWEALSAAAARAHSPEEQYRYLYALGDFTDPALVSRGLENVLSPRVRTQNAGKYLERFLVNPAAQQTAWGFMKAHWKELEPKLSVAFADVGVVQALGTFCDARSRDDVKSFFASHKLGNASRNVDQTVERINNCIDLKEKQSSIVDAWLRSRPAR